MTQEDLDMIVVSLRYGVPAYAEGIINRLGVYIKNHNNLIKENNKLKEVKKEEK